MAPSRLQEDGFDVAIPGVPVTEQRRPFVQGDNDQELKNPGTARANIAATAETPHGTQKDGWATRYKNQSVLQQHCAFFDTDGDGEIWPLDTFRGFRRLGYGLIVSSIAVLVIHINFSYPTVAGFFPDPFFRLFIERIHKAKHGSDSGGYDHEGRFVPQQYEDIFTKYASGDKQSITIYEIWEMIKAQRNILDPIGWCGAIFEWGITWLMLWPEDGKMKKEDIRRIFDGSLFFEFAARREKVKN